MLDKERAIRLLEGVNFNKEMLDEIRNTERFDFFVRAFLAMPEDLETWTYFGSRNFSNKIVANAFVTYVTWD